MAVKKYADLNSVSKIADYVNGKLTVVSSIPSSPTKLRTVLYIGETTEDYIQGGIYLYDEDNDEWILISTADVDLTDYETSWTGTLAEWQALDEEEQSKYEIINITDDFVPGTTDHVAKGYYYNGKFYEDGAFTKEMPGVIGFIYIDLPYDDLYVYDDNDSEFVLASGGGSDSIVWGYYYEGSFYEDSAHTTIITAEEDYLYVDLGSDSIYIYKSNIYVQISGSGSYTAGFGIDIADEEIKTTDFVGTAQEWANVPDKTIYDFVHITDDTSQVEEGAPGHSISDGTSEKTQREILEFEGFEVTDDSENGKTKIADIPYTAGDGIDITNREVTTDPDLLPFTFVGDTATWNGLSSAEKAQYKLVNLTDDVAGGDLVVEDAVTKDSVNPVTSGAVYAKFPEYKTNITAATRFSDVSSYLSISNFENGILPYIVATRADGFTLILRLSAHIVTSSSTSARFGNNDTAYVRYLNIWDNQNVTFYQIDVNTGTTTELFGTGTWTSIKLYA